MRLFALIGYPLGHSFSKKYFTEKFEREGIPDARYDLFPLESIGQLPALLTAHPDLVGLNVTIPYKEQVIPYLHGLDDTARAAGAVNCIRVQAGRLTGYNTDVTGFENSLAGWLPENRPLQALVLGTGGAAKAVVYVLHKKNIPFRYVSRHPSGPDQFSYEDLTKVDLADFPLIINTTPVGMAPAVEACPNLPFEQLGSKHFVYDLVYNPAETLLLQRAAARGCAVKNGLDMLYGQAEKAWEIWNP